MAKNRKKRRRNGSEDSLSIFNFISEETAHGILGVFSVVLSIFFILSAFELAGSAGEMVFDWLSYLFGFGYYLLPIVFLLLAISFLREQERSFATPQIFGSLVLFISSLGLLNLFSDTGGVIGSLISKPLDSFFYTYFSAVILLALVAVSILVTFNVAIKFDVVSLIKQIFSKKEPLPMDALENRAIDKAVRAMEESNKTNNEDAPPRQNLEAQTKGKKSENGNEGFSPMIMRRSGKHWTPPPLSLLEGDRGKPGVGDIKANANLIKRTLMNFGIVVEMDEISIGPSVTRYALKPAEGVKLSKILGLQNNLELALAAHPVRIEAPIPGKSLVGIEVPNTLKSTVGLVSLVADEEYTRSTLPLLFAIGRDIAGRSHFANLARMPHLLIAGATGSGKSVTIHTIVTSLLFRNPPENLKFIMIDPKRVELTMYNNIPHLLTPVITDPKKAILALKWAAKEMERRYDILEKASARDIASYHQSVMSKSSRTGEETDKDTDKSMPFIVVIIDEMADLMQSYPRELEAAVVRLAQMSRAVGIHLILSTQRPSVNIITGLIKANIPARIALQVSSQIDSRTILDTAGAEKLLGAGDLLFLSGEMSKPLRMQSAYISEKEVKGVTKYLGDTYADELQSEINFSGENTSNAIFSATLEEDDSYGDNDDELYEEARETVIHAGKASTSFLQRKLRIGYARAARLVDMLEERGVIGAGSGAKAREVIDRNTETMETEDAEKT
ncbi:MAG: cell division protein FtsK [Candidatus Zambryskibacteria bacterium CG22_combo_CG10-13_8_21_14_all_42_17]|uniref:Cell division protein FtsK n=1 Tax=Candidatus Zambryskibacteria bacterium CG22_combo_CG10-13_8_21_14_all_42_17 TaxID=1975118 RepID=A0A2H0BD69_9BACT|nr:MAG: cell division protein FtsK [Candidatus Zambryskibacteria bacterium CG22_combo_CG10-13_8_21_14_all_42_17]